MLLPRRIGRHWMLAAKLLVLAAVVWGVARTFSHGWRQLGQHEWQIRWPWLAAASGLYLIGLLPPAWYWWRILHALGGQPPWFHTFACYMFGHLGKYVPGKGLVVVMRAMSLPRETASFTIAVISVFLETLTLMSVGALLAAVLLLWLVGWHVQTVGIALAVLVVVGVPTIPPVTRRIVQWASSRRITAPQQYAAYPVGEVPIRELNLQLMACGWVASSMCWLLLGASLWAVVQSLGSGVVVQPADLPLLVAAVSLATVAGFVSLIPGGLGVRDGLLLITLAPKFGEATALVATVLLRLVWVFSEVGVCGILYAFWRGRSEG